MTHCTPPECAAAFSFILVYIGMVVWGVRSQGRKVRAELKRLKDSEK